LAALAEVEISLKRLDRRRYEAHHVGQPVGGGDPCPELTEFEPGLAQVGLERPQLRLAAQDGLRVALGLKQHFMRLGQHEDEYGVLVARAVARLLEREVLGEEAREVRIELGDRDGTSSTVAASAGASAFADSIGLFRTQSLISAGRTLPKHRTSDYRRV